MLNGHILVDFDGTLSGDPGHGKPYKPDETGPPIKAMVERVKHWLACGIEVKIFTGRVADDPQHIAEKAVKDWCLIYLGKELEVTCKKDANTFAIWDDRAVRVEKDTGKCISYPIVAHEKEEAILEADGKMWYT